LAAHVRGVRVRREAVLEPDLGRDGRLAQARQVALRALDAQHHTALLPRHGERGDERQAGVLSGDRQLDQLENGRQTVERHHVDLDDRTGFGRLLGQLSAQ
jgi:hypothetical protein